MPCAAVRVTKGQTDTFVALSSDVCFLSHNKSLVSISYSTAELLAASEFAVASSQPPISSCRLAYMRVKGKNQTENRIKTVDVRNCDIRSGRGGLPNILIICILSFVDDDVDVGCCVMLVNYFSKCLQVIRNTLHVNKIVNF
jgi:hypothetical protein